MARDWTIQEVEWILEDYFRILELEIRGEKYVKMDFIRGLLPKLKNRNKSSIERKHQNISAVLNKYRYPSIVGYKPLSHYQRLLESQVLDFLDRNPQLDQLFMDFVNREVSVPSNEALFSKWEKEAPLPALAQDVNSPPYSRRLVKPDYLEMEHRNRLLGAKGEQLIFEYEQWRLHRAGKSHLADRVEWISKEQGDGAGFDILSRNANGTDRYIEVKTTKLGELTPIYVTRNELEFSKQHEAGYHVYRVFKYGADPQFFVRSGAIDRGWQLEAVEWVGRF